MTGWTCRWNWWPRHQPCITTMWRWICTWWFDDGWQRWGRRTTRYPEACGIGERRHGSHWGTRQHRWGGGKSEEGGNTAGKTKIASRLPWSNGSTGSRVWCDVRDTFWCWPSPYQPYRFSNDWAASTGCPKEKTIWGAQSDWRYVANRHRLI